VIEDYYLPLIPLMERLSFLIILMLVLAFKGNLTLSCKKHSISKLTS
jgi:hypothetical protein